MGGFFRPGDPIKGDDGAVLSTVSQVFDGGRGRWSGVLLSWQAGAGHGVWLVDGTGKVRPSMRTGDVIAAQGAFVSRVVEALRAGTDDGN